MVISDFNTHFIQLKIISGIKSSKLLKCMICFVMFSCHIIQYVNLKYQIPPSQCSGLSSKYNTVIGTERVISQLVYS